MFEKVKKTRAEFFGLKHCPSLADFSNVENLCLRMNEIKSVSNLFTGMASKAVNTKLRQLDLSYNRLTSLKANELSRLVGLTRLNLHENTLVAIEKGAFSGLVNLQELVLSYSDKGAPLDLAVFGDEPDLVNLRYLRLKKDFGSKNTYSIMSSVDSSQLFAQCRHQVVFQADQLFFEVQGAHDLFDGLVRVGRILLILRDY
jgi:Leucine-rich repeat (LRR) protein